MSETGLGFKYFFCSECGVIHHGPKAGRCKVCRATYFREYQRKRRAADPIFKTKQNCRAIANSAQRSGRIKASPCQWCGAAKAHKHHDDYGKPLNIEWLCEPCHRKFHKNHKVAERIVHLRRALQAAA